MNTLQAHRRIDQLNQFRAIPRLPQLAVCTAASTPEYDMVNSVDATTI